MLFVAPPLEYATMPNCLASADVIVLSFDDAHGSHALRSDCSHHSPALCGGTPGGPRGRPRPRSRRNFGSTVTWQGEPPPSTCSCHTFVTKTAESLGTAHTQHTYRKSALKATPRPKIYYG